MTQRDPQNPETADIPHREERTVIVDRRGGSALAVIGALIVIVLLAGLAYVMLSGGEEATIDVDVPEVTLDVTPDGQ